MKTMLKRINIKDKEVFLIYCICSLLGIIYITWRIFFTIDYSMGFILLIWPICLLGAEIYSFVVFTLFTLATINVRKLKTPSNMKDINYFPSVDIFICTYNESESLLRDTIVGCVNIKYKNKKIYLLDDGHRPSMKQLANELGINYITRDKNTGFKAGNINNALKQTNGELIVIYDADHIPVSTFLMELVDFFKDEKVGLVQSPQHFLNPDPFQKILSSINNEQDLFFRVIEPGLADWNAAICAGTNFMVRRKAIEEAGGIPQKTITEDMDLGLRLQGMGYHIKYYNKPLAVGLAPETFKDFLNQRLRWCTGTLQIYLLDGKSSFYKLSIMQKLFYFNGVLYYFFGFPRLIFLISPILFLLFGVEPLFANLYETVVLLGVYYVSKIYLFRKIAKKYRNVLVTDVYEASVAFYLAINIIKAITNPRQRTFKITQKDVSKIHANLKLYLPQLIILAFAISCFLLIGFEFIYYYHFYQWDIIVANLFWNTYNTIALIFAIKVAFEKKDKRKEQDRRIPVKMEAKIEDSHHNLVNINVVNLSKKGALLFSQRDKKEEFEAILEDNNSLILPEQPEKISLKIVNTYKKGDSRYYHVYFDIDSNEKADNLLKVAIKDSENW